MQNYFVWLKDKTVLKEIDNQWVQITTPHLDRHNDCLQIYVKKQGDGFLLTDDGYILNDLISSGCELKTPRRQSMLKTCISGFGVLLEDDQLIVHASLHDFALKKHSLIQAMLAINDLFYLATPNVKSLFIEDVGSWLDSANIRYVPMVKFSGKSGFDHMFNFVIPKSRNSPERLLQVLNAPDKKSVELLMFEWLDTRETRPADSKLFALLNDTSTTISSSTIDALRNYESTPILWTEREKARDILVA